MFVLRQCVKGIEKGIALPRLESFSRAVNAPYIVYFGIPRQGCDGRGAALVLKHREFFVYYL